MNCHPERGFCSGLPEQNRSRRTPCFLNSSLTYRGVPPRTGASATLYTLVPCTVSPVGAICTSGCTGATRSSNILNASLSR
jgi:hypothetical protein